MSNQLQKSKAAVLAAAFGIFSVFSYIPEAEAKRFGGGSSFGRSAPSFTSKPAPVQKTAPAQPSGTQQAATAPKPASGIGAAASQPRRSFMGPLGGLAAGLGLAALFGYLGFGEGMASVLGTMLMLGVGFFLVRALFRMLARNSSPQPAYQGSGQGMRHTEAMYREPLRSPAALPSSSVSRSYSGNQVDTNLKVDSGSPVMQTPEGFNEQAFLDNAKKFFVMIQAAFDRGDLASLKEYCGDDVLAYAAQEIQSRGSAENHTSVVTLEAELLGFETDIDEQIATVAFKALLREDRESVAQEVSELWILTRPISGGGWLLSGIHNL